MPRWVAKLGFGDKQVDRRNYKECEKGADEHSGYKHDTDAVAGSRPRAIGKNQRCVSHDGGDGGHQYWTQTCS